MHRMGESCERPGSPGPFEISLEQLCKAMPVLPGTIAGAYLPHLRDAMREWSIDTPARAAAFLAQLAHESVDLTILEELAHRAPVSWCGLCQRTRKGHAAGVQYEGRSDLGNLRPGDGVRFKGRGAIQLTGRANYREYGQAFGIDLEADPERALEPDLMFRIAARFWHRKGLNAYADIGDFETITRRINGGLNGQAHRLRKWARAKAALGVTP